MPKVKEPTPQYLPMNQMQNAQLLLQEIQQLPNDAISEVMNYIQFLRSKVSNKKTRHFLTGKELAESEIVGLWSNRKIGDSVEYARKLRQRAEQRL